MHVLPAAILMNEPPWTKRKVPHNLKSRKRGGSSSSVKRASSTKNANEEERQDAVSVVSMKKISSSGVICDDLEKEAEDTFPPVTRNARVFSRNGVDNPAFTGSKLDVREKVEKTEVCYIS